MQSTERKDRQGPLATEGCDQNTLQQEAGRWEKVMGEQPRAAHLENHFWLLINVKGNIRVYGFFFLLDFILF